MAQATGGFPVFNAGMTKRGLSVEERFWLKVNKTDGCWLWTASQMPGGYAQFRTGIKGDSGSAARFSWELHYGPLEKGRRVVPTCGNGMCVRPDHLAAGAEARFWAKVNKDGPIHQQLGQCWVWTGAVSGAGKGYGYGECVTDSGKTMRAHRFSYILHYGEIEKGLDVDHRCRNRLCVRPDHLRAATRKQNMENQGACTTSKTGCRGVYLAGVDHFTKDQWYGVHVRHNKTKYCGGYYTDLRTAEEAAVKLRNSLYTHNDDDRRQREPRCEHCGVVGGGHTQDCLLV